MLQKYRYRFYILLALVLFALVPYTIGLLIQSHYQKNLALVAKTMKIGLRPLIFHRSWLHTDVILAASFPLADKPLDTRYLDRQNILMIKQRIYHGPLLYNHASKTKFGVGCAEINSYLMPDILFAKTTIPFHGDIQTSINLNRYNLVANKHIVYALDGLKGRIDFGGNKNKRSFVTTVSVNKLISNIGTHREIVNFITRQQLQQNGSGLWLGSKKYHFDQLSWRLGNQEVLFNKIDFVINTLPEGQKIKTEIFTEVQAAVVNHINYGPSNFKMSVHGMDEKALADLQNKLPNAVIQTLEETNALQQQFKTLLSKGLSLNVESCSLNTAWGPANLAAKVFCPPSASSGAIQGKLPLELANRFLTYYYLLLANSSNTSAAEKKADHVILEWQQKGLLVISGAEVMVNLKW